jgi:hypothetical protein
MDPSCRVRCDWLRRDPSPPIIRDCPLQTDHTVPYGTGPVLRLFLAMNCQATIIQSLRDKGPFAHRPVRPYADTPHPAPFS